MSEKITNITIKPILLCCLGYLLISIPVFIATFNFFHLMLVWNVLLALLPLIFAIGVKRSLNQSKKIHALVLSLLWLFFFPNAPYMITDFIHIGGIEFYWKVAPYSSVTYSTDMMAWLRVVHIGVGVLLGTLLGMLSLYIIHRVLIKRNRLLGHSAVVSVSLISGYAIYIGRFLRFNSWDILRPVTLIVQLINDVNHFTIAFSLIYGLYVLLCYCIFYAFYHQRAF